MLDNFIIAELSTTCKNDWTGLENSLRDWVEVTYQNTQGDVESVIPEHLILRFDVRFNWKIGKNIFNKLTNLFVPMVKERFNVKNIYLLYTSDYQIVFKNISMSDDETLLIRKLSTIRSYELMEMALKDNVIYHNFGNHLFRHPSGEVSDFFFRTGNIFVEYCRMKVFWFWMIPYLSKVSSIISDTWSISILTAYLANRIQEYSQSKNIISWSYLPGYIGDDKEMHIDLKEAFLSSKTKNLKTLFLLSASASGRSQDAILEIAKQCEISTSEFELLTLYKLSEKWLPGSNLCDLSGKFLELGLQGFVNQKNIPVSAIINRIDKTTYFPQYYNDSLHEFIVGEGEDSHTKKSQDFFQKYSGYEIFSVCKDGRSNRALSRPRHHAYHIDAEILFGTAEFLNQLACKINNIPKVTHLVCLKTRTDRYLRDKILSQLNYECECIELDSFSEISSNEEIYGSFVLSDAILLFVDSMTISGGSRLKKFQIALRDVIEEQGLTTEKINCNLYYLVGVARPPSEEKLIDLEAYFKKSAPDSSKYLSLIIVENIILPDWHENKCPWCREAEINLKVLRELEDDMEAKDRRYVENRIKFLQNPYGLKNEVFFRRYKSDHYVFKLGSYFLDKEKMNKTQKEKFSEADLACAVSSAIQIWRGSTTNKAPANYVIDTKILFDANLYNESMLRAAIWRAVRCGEIKLRGAYDDQCVRSFLQYVYFSAELEKLEDREEDFVLGFEAAIFLRGSLDALLGEERFNSIDWEFLRLVAQEKPSY